MNKKKYYAYNIENKKGVVYSWDECLSLVKGKKGKYKKFYSMEEAEFWLEHGVDKKPELEEGIYFDAGTGGKIGVEVRVTNKEGDSMLHLLLPKEKINSRGNYLAPAFATNNYGELLGCYIALRIAIDRGMDKIFGDSKLVIDYWSLGRIKKEGLNKETIDLSSKVSNLRNKYVSSGGKLKYISGDINPADLGWHKKK